MAEHSSTDAMTADRTGDGHGTLVYRQSIWTRLTHWLWAVCLFFLLLSGLQIFNAHPVLYVGDQSGFQFDNSVLRIGAVQDGDRVIGRTTILGRDFDTTGVLGLSGAEGRMENRAFPSWATIPSFRDLATGRVVHFFFAWALFFTLLVWLAASLLNGHFRRDIVPDRHDIAALPRDVVDHARFRFRHRARYGPLQKLSYAIVLLVFLPLMFATGLAMSPGMNAAMPWLPELFGGRQSARTVHFVVMVLLAGFFVVHVAMVAAAGPVNEMRSMITGWFRTSPSERLDERRD